MLNLDIFAKFLLNSSQEKQIVVGSNYDFVCESRTNNRKN